jgi:plastocyanin
MRGVGIALMAAAGGTLLSPASPLADGPVAPPAAVLDAPSRTVPAGKPLKLDSSASTPGAGTIVGHVWDLDGNGSFESDTHTDPTAQLTPKKAGALTVRVRVLDDLGQSSDAGLDLKVTKPKPAPAVTELSGTSTGQGQGAVTASARTTTAPALVPPTSLHHARHVTKPPKKARKAPTVTAAASTGVTIKNFKFSPGSSSVHVGDTITWANKDIAPHTATASDGSFDTGTINKNKSGSHTFTKAGSFPYICSIHPSMKGTVTVLASSSSGSGSGGTSSGTTGSNGTGSTANPSSSGSSSPSSSSSLPHTGLDIAVLVFIAMCLTGSGASLRRALR